MPILALCEKGLILDVFGSKPKIFDSEAYKTSNNKLVSVYNSKVKFIDFENASKAVEVTIPGFCEMIQSKDGEKVAIMCHNKVLRVYKDSILINELLDVENFGISNEFYCFSTKTEVKIFNYQTVNPIFEITASIKTIHCLNSSILFITEKADTQRVLLFKNGKVYRLLEHPQIFRTIVESDENSILLLADTEYTGNSYYADSILYYIKFTELSELSDLYKNNENSDQKLIALNELYGIVTFTTLKKVHSFGYYKKGVHVCFGDQPACVHFYSSCGVYEKKLSKAVRNLVIFNRSGKRAINAGFGNLPGNIEVFENGNSVCYFESLGASHAAWLNDDSRFMVATTNYFKSDNKICIYDYYGRLLEIMECKSLVSAEVYGSPEKELEIVQPEKILKQKVLTAYVPPHLQSNAGALPVYTAPQKVKKQPKAKTAESVKKEIRSVELVQKELAECNLLKEKLKSGEDLSLEDENKVFKIKSLQEELEKLSNKKL